MVITAASAAYLNTALEPTPTAFAPASLRLLARLTASVRLKGGDTFHINLCDTDDKYGDVMTVRK